MLAPMRHPVLVWLSLAAALSLACPSAEERAEAAREAAREALGRGDRGGALRELATLRALRPDTPEDLRELAELLVIAGEAPQALRLLEEGVSEWPERDELRVALAQVALLVADYSAARRAVAPIEAESPQHAAALLLRAQAELRLGRFDRAVSMLAEAERLYPERPEARIARIGALLGERRMEEAGAALAEAREAMSGSEAEEALRGLEISMLSARAEEEPEAAISGLRALVDAQPEDARAWRALVQAMVQSGRAAEASELMRAAIERDPSRLHLYAPLAMLRRAAGHPEEARAVLDELIANSPSPTAYLALAQHHASENDPDATADALRRGLEAFPGDALLLRAEAEALLAREDPAAARRAVERYRKLFPDDPNSEYLRARLELVEGDVSAAIARLTDLMPRLDQPFSQYWLGQALERRGDLAGAERRYGLALQRDGGDPGLYPPLVRMAEARGDWRQVAGLGERLARIAPQHFEGWSAWITGLIRLGDGARAEPVARHAAGLFPGNEDAQIQLARALRGAGKADAALELLGEVAGRFPESGRVEAERVLTMGLAGRLTEGLAAAEEALAVHPDSAVLHSAHAQLLFAAGEAEAGAAAVDRALAAAPEDPEPLAIRARFRAATGRLAGAREDSERYLEARPDDPAMHFVLGVVHESAGRPEEAIAAHRRAARLDAKAFAPRNNLAYLLADRDLDAALTAAQEAYALQPDSPAVLDTLGWLYLRKGLVERATSLLEEAHAGAPELAEVQLHLALAHREAGRSDEARELLTALSEREDGSPELKTQVQDALRSLQ